MPGPDIVFWPEHKKCSANFTKHPLQYMKLMFVFAFWPEFRSPNNVEKACQPPSESTDVLVLITLYLNYYKFQINYRRQYIHTPHCQDVKLVLYHT